MSDATPTGPAGPPPPGDRLAQLEAERALLSAQVSTAYAQLAEVTSRVLAMSEAATALVATHDAPSAAAAALDVVLRALNAPAGAAFLSHGGGEFELIAAIGLDDERQELLASSLPDMAVAQLAECEQRTYDAHEVAADPSFLEWRAAALAEDPGADVMPHLDLYVPLLLDGRPVAVLAVAARAGGAPYDESDRLFAEHVGDQGALAIDRALLFAQNKERLDDLDALLKVSRELASTLDLDHVIVTAVNLTGAIVKRERAVLALLDGGKLKVRAVSDFARVDANTVDRLGLAKLLEWLSYKRFETFEANLAAVEADPEHEGRDVLLEYFGGPMRALYAIGLRDDQGPVGVLLLESYVDGAFRSESDREALGVLAGQLSVAIRNAELYRQLPMVGALAPLAERRRQWQRLDPARRLRIVIGSAAVLVLVAFVPFPRAIAGDAQVLPTDAVAVRAPVDGIVRAVTARAGAYVAAGERLATLEPEGYAARLEALRADADRAAARLALASQGVDPTARNQAALDQRAALARLADAEREGALAQLTAPSAGYVLTPDLAERVGARLAAGDVLCQVSRADSLRVEIAVSETDVAGVGVGGPLRLKVLGFPDRQFQGRVTEVSWQGEPTRRGRPSEFRVGGVVANTGGRLKSGMTGRARLDVPAETLLARWSRGIWRWLRLSFWL